jgi:hypothetical protein
MGHTTSTSSSGAESQTQLGPMIKSHPPASFLGQRKLYGNAARKANRVRRQLAYTFPDGFEVQTLLQEGTHKRSVVAGISRSAD